MDRLPPQQRNLYESAFDLADEAYRAGRVATHSSMRTRHWTNWCTYVHPLGVDPYLQQSSYSDRALLLAGFAARIRRGDYGRGKQIKAKTVSTALTAVGQTITLECETNPVKVRGTENFLPRIQRMLDGWKKEDPPTLKMLPVEVDVPEYIASVARIPTATELDRTIGDLALIAFYYLLRVGEYTGKAERNETKQTVQFKFEDITFFKRNTRGDLRCLPRTAPGSLIATADGATLKLDNQKNGWKGVCIFQEANGDPFFCPVRAIGRRFLHLRDNKCNNTEFLSTYWD
jgi:hypothetical protein